MEENERSFKCVVVNLAKRWFIDAFSGMAQGLFCTLIAGTILSLIAKWVGVDNYFGGTLIAIANIAKTLMGAGIGVGMAHALKSSKLTLFSATVAGFAGAFSDKILAGGLTLALGAPGNPIGAYVVSLIVIEITSLYAGKTKLDILLIPLGALALCFAGFYAAYPFIWLVNQLGNFIAWATGITPFFMGIIIAVVMGVLLTMPTSSAAIWIAVAKPVADGYLAGTVSLEAYNGIMLAGGAAVVGCSCHMIGFAVASFRENGISGLISQGIGTSMLQIPNIMKKPAIMLPEIIASAILGPVATMTGFMCDYSGGGMGTSGLVGVFGAIDANAATNGFLLAAEILLLLFILPAAISFGFSELFRKTGLISFGDQKLE
ncbi:MAG: PTS sugar transporter subunit IIC [Clostridia bacterium]|nr:PTS sugar transporter subunit IIC [Clostridia bacterium]